MIFVNIYDPLIGDVGSDHLLGMFEVKHLEQHEAVDGLFCHGLLSSDANLLDFIRILRMQLLLFLFASFGNIHWIKEHLAQGEGLLINGSELIIHNYYEQLYISNSQHKYVLIVICRKSFQLYNNY